MQRAVMGVMAAALALLPGPAAAAVTVYDSFAAITAVGVVPTTTFIAPMPDAGTVETDLSSPFTVGPVRFSGSDYLALYDDYATYIGGSATLTIATPPSAAVGLYYSSYSGETVDVFVNGVDVVAGLVVPFEAIGFIGFTSDTPIRSIVFAGGETDIERGFVSSVPEPATWLQLTIGTALVGVTRRRRTRRTAAQSA